MDQEVIAKIQKLMALGTSSNANEASNAMAAAQAMMDKYRISMAELEEKTGEKKEKPIRDAEPFFEGARITSWRKYLIGYITKFNDCAYYHSSGYRNTTYYVFGRESDLATARYMFAFAESEIARLCKLHCKGKGHVYADMWCTGAVAGINEQLKAARTVTQAAVTTTAMVLLNERQAESRTAMYEMVPGLRPSTFVSHSRGSADAYNHGKVIGRECINMGTNQALPSGSKKLGQQSYVMAERLEL